MSKRYRPGDKISWKEVDELVVAVHLDTGVYHSLNATASEIWKHVVSGRSMEEVIDDVAAKFDVDKPTLKRDAVDCVRTWLETDLIADRSEDERR
jgi:hypothetical protein